MPWPGRPTRPAALLTPFTGSLTDVARATLAVVIVSLLGTLAAILALYDLLRDRLDENGRLRAVFYLLIFPSACFLAMAYTEGLFLGIAFSVLALSKRGKWLAVLACLVCLRQEPALALFGLAVACLSTFSGAGQGLARYVLPVVPMYLVLARAGRNPVFDRLWTIASVFAMGLSAALFAFDFWIG